MRIRQKLSDKVITAIKEDIAAGRFRRGGKLPAEHELMELYAVGRSTVREAIKTLAIAGILRVQQGSGTFVSQKFREEPLAASLRRADFEEINAVRALLEKEMVRLACSHADAAGLLQIQTQLELRAAAIREKQLKKCRDADIAFHVSIAKASGNTVLSDLYQNFTRVIREFFNQRDQEELKHFAESQALHEDLGRAIAARNPELSAAILTRLLANNY